ncbi:tRNA (guanosine(37)-N1)-methyltransferase TrmD [Candidatus Uhrbacteria bacterium]|nr:tRNA (guanosine(37)-N1)-methyltransferase TrmD [Candidatus Uhrbacteria bacterium]
MKFDILTIFPEMFSGYFGESIIKRAVKKKLLDIRVHDLRKWATDKHHKVDDKPYGGGPGMVFKVEPIFKALRALKVHSRQFTVHSKKETRVILTSARGKQFTAADARRLAKYKRVVIICGRYEGVDERVAEHLVDEEISIGPYVLTGGELPAMVMIDSIARQVPGVLGKQESLEESRGGGFPTYTRPEVFESKEQRAKRIEWKVPKVLLSGDPKKIAAWRAKRGGEPRPNGREEWRKKYAR